jgi:hypothetical protein
MCFIVCPKIWCAADELGELRGIEYELMEEGYVEAVESRSIDPGHDVLQIVAYAFEIEIRESGEDKGRGRRRTSAFSVRAGSRRLESEVK